MRLSIIEILFIGEGLMLASAGLCYLVGRIAARRNRDDYLYRMMSVFWWEFRYSPLFGGAPPARPSDVVEGSSEPIEKGDWEGMIVVDEPSPESTTTARARAVVEKPGGRADDVAEETSATITVRVIPHSGGDRVAAVNGDSVQIEVTAAAEKGEANKAMTNVLTEALDVKPYQIQLVRGHYQTQKVVRVAGMDQQEVEQKLASRL